MTDGYYNYKMDVWGVGCVFFEILSLFPLFPGNNEKDQIHKIHNILGTPPRQILDHFRKYASNIDFNFPSIVGTGINQLIAHISPEGQELISKLLTYNPDERPTCRQVINSPYFKDIHNQEPKSSIHRELGGISPASAVEEHSADATQEAYQPKKTLKAAETVAEYPPGYKKKMQQGTKKTVGGEGESEPITGNDYEDSAAINNVTLLKN